MYSNKIEEQPITSVNLNREIVYTDEDITSIKKMLDIFVTAKAKYHLFSFINKYKKNNMYKNFLCESLFRHIILELYATFFDNDENSLAYQILSKFIKLSKQNIKELLGNITKLKNLLKHYRNDILAHKSRKLKEEFCVTSDDLARLVDVLEKLISSILKIIEPTTFYVTDIIENPEEAIRWFFKDLATINEL